MDILVKLDAMPAWARGSLLACACAIALFSVAVTRASAACPLNTISEGCEDWLGVQSPLPGAQWDISGEGVPWQAGDPCPVGCYDLRAGVLVASGHASPWQECGAAPQVYDDFRIVGVGLPPSPIPFTAEMWVQGTIEGGGTIRAGIAEGFLYTDDELVWTSGTVDQRISLSLQHAPEEIFTLTSRLLAAGNGREGDIHASATIHFSGLPPGAYIVSCQGYDLPVPTQPTTWGAVKATYR